MNHLLASIVRDVFVPTTLIGAVFYGAVCFGIAAVAARLIRVVASHGERHLTDGVVNLLLSPAPCDILRP